MNDRIKKLAKQAMAGDNFPEAVTYTAEKAESAADIGCAIKEYLKIQPIVIAEDEYIVDRFRWTGVNVPTDYYRANGSENRMRYWGTLCSAAPTDVFYWGWTHVALDFGYILQNGFAAYYERIRQAAKKYKDDEEKLDFLEGMRFCLDGFADRYKMFAEKAAAMAAVESTAEKKAMFLRIADTCSRIPLEPAKSFYDAVQFTWIAFMIAPDSLGRIDQYLYPYYIADLESGEITKEFAFELLEELFVKVHESQADNVNLDISGHNHLVVGGYLQNGEDGFNELSKVILEAIVDLPTYRPQASFRYTKKTLAETMRYITEMNKKSQLIVFVNDEARIKGMMDCGFAWEDAVEYSVIGCNEWSIVGKSKMDLAHINLLHSLQQALYENKEPASYEEFYETFEKELKADFDKIIEEYSVYNKVQGDDLNVLTSIFHEGCIENALSFAQNGSKYYGLTMSFNSISNVADSLSVIRQFVFEEKKFTFRELLTALENNWAGYEDMRLQILREGHFFGNDDDYADNIAKAVGDSIYSIKLTVDSPCIKNLVVGSFVGATHPNIIFGKRTKATPDGRYAGEEFTMGISQSQGKDKKGVTALLKSIAKLDYSKLCGCIVSNLKMDQSMADTPEKLDKLAAIYHTFLMLGGMQLQINYISTEELLEAQAHPEQYENLLVRVTGYSGFFTRFDTELQNDIIKRTSQC